MTWIQRRVKQERDVEGQAGAITFVQRFDSAARISPHLHVLALDAGFVQTAAGQAFFYEVPAPSDSEIAKLNKTIAKRVLRLFRKLGLDDICGGLDLEHDARGSSPHCRGRRTRTPSSRFNCCKAASRREDSPRPRPMIQTPHDERARRLTRGSTGRSTKGPSGGLL